MAVVYKVNGKSVSRKEFVKDSKGAGNISRSWESKSLIVSEGAAVHPKDRARAEELATQHGVPTHFDGDGRPTFTSLRHQTKYLRTIGMHNHDGIH